MYTDPIVEELHDIRERMAKECKARSISLCDYLKEGPIPEGMKRAMLEPAKVDFSKLSLLKAV